MIDYYPLLIEYSIEFKRFSRKYLSDLKSKRIFAYKQLFIHIDRHYIETESAREANVAEGYRLEHYQLDDKVYCLKGA